MVGEQPVLDPGEEFEYTSGSHLKTEMGTMHGSYQMVNDQGESLEVEILLYPFRPWNSELI